MSNPSDKSTQMVERLVSKYTEKSGTTTHPNPKATNAVKKGLKFAGH